MEIHVIAAVIIGGTSLFGGKGSILGTVMGGVLLSMMTNALTNDPNHNTIKKLDYHSVL